jgi:hypothetical protein
VRLCDTKRNDFPVLHIGMNLQCRILEEEIIRSFLRSDIVGNGNRLSGGHQQTGIRDLFPGVFIDPAVRDRDYILEGKRCVFIRKSAYIQREADHDGDRKSPYDGSRDSECSAHVDLRGESTGSSGRIYAVSVLQRKTVVQDQIIVPARIPALLFHLFRIELSVMVLSSELNDAPSSTLIGVDMWY